LHQHGSPRDKSCRYVVTPNTDHAVLFQEQTALQAAYRDASLVLADPNWQIGEPFGPLLLTLAVVTLWGFSFVPIKVGLREMPPFALAVYSCAALIAFRYVVDHPGHVSHLILLSGQYAESMPQPFEEKVARVMHGDFAAYRQQRAMTAWKYAMWDAGCKMPTQVPDGRAQCFCGAEIDMATMDGHICAAHMAA
jgi:hypothetical protein